MTINWRKLEQPRRWTPIEEGAELVGFYLGQTVQDGQFGQYKVVMLAAPESEGVRPYTASGTAIIRALEATGIQPGAFIRVVYKGTKELSGGRTMKVFDVFIGEGSITLEQAHAYMADMEAE